MKKLLSIFTAGAVLLGSLGFFSCSGDLHDNETQPLFIIGGGVGCVNEDWKWGQSDKQLTLVEADGSVQKYEFTATASQASFKLATAQSWNNDIAGDDVTEAYPVINGDFIKLHSREAEGLPNTKNIIINDLAVGEKYTINVKFDSTTLATSLQVKGPAVVMPELSLAISGTSENFPDKDKDGNELTYTFERKGTEYTYDFIAKADETVDFYLESSTAGLTYGGATITSVASDLTVYDDTEMSIDVEKDHRYTLTVSVPTLTTATVKFETVKLLKEATINANWIYEDAYYEQDVSKGSVQFIAKHTSFEFTVNRKKGAEDLAWGTGTIVADGSAQELTYNSEGKAKAVKVTGLSVGTCYKIILTEDTANFELSAEVITVPKSDLSNFIIAGGFGLKDDEGNEIEYGGWFGSSSVTGFPVGFKAKATSEADVYEFTFTATAATHEFAIHEDGDWDVKYCCGAELSVGGDYKELGFGLDNAKATGLVVGNTYKILAKNGYGSITAKVILVE